MAAICIRYNDRKGKPKLAKLNQFVVKKKTQRK